MYKVGVSVCVRVLLQAGADVDAKDVDGWTPLHAAAHWAEEEACQLLADNMCNMVAKNNLVGGSDSVILYFPKDSFHTLTSFVLSHFSVMWKLIS